MRLADLFEDISDVIQSELSKTGMKPREVNDGYCGFLADNVVKRTGGEVIDSIELNQTMPHHCFIAFDDRYYDAENQNGVDDWRKLRYFRRHLKARR